jgi:hypothetical protein
MTTTTMNRPESAGIAWPSLIWIGVLHLGAMLAFVPEYFSWSALAACFVLHWLTGGIGICMTYHRSDGSPTTAAITPTRTRKTTSTARTAGSAGPTCSGG